MMRPNQKTIACLLALLLAAAVFSGCRKEIPITDIPDPAISAAPSASEDPAAPTSPAASSEAGDDSAENAAPAATAAPSGGSSSGGSSSGGSSSGSSSSGNTAGTSGDGTGSTADPGTASGGIGGGSSSGGSSGGSSSGNSSSGTNTRPVTEEGYLINFEYIHNGDGTARFSDYRKNIAFDSPTDLDVLSDGIGETAVLLTDRNNAYAIGDNVTGSYTGSADSYLKDYLDRNLPAYFEDLYGGFENESLTVSASGNASGTVTADGKTYTVQAELIPTGSGGMLLKAVIAPEGSGQLSALNESMMDLREAY